MNKRERVLAALDGRPVDKVPFTIWRHFYAQDRTAQDLARATISFYRRYDPDIIVMLPGPLYMAEAWAIDIRSFGNDEIEQGGENAERFFRADDRASGRIHELRRRL